MTKYILSLFSMALMLAACGTQQATNVVDSLLSRTQPTLLFFYTDN